MHIGAFKHGAAISINDFALLGDNIVIINDVFTNIEVVAFNLRLSLFDEARDHGALERHILFHANHFHDLGHTVGSETAHKFIIQGQEETRLTRVALASGTSTQLVINTAGFVTLGTNDVQATKRDDEIVIGITLADLLLEEFVLFLIGHVLDVLLNGLFFVETLIFVARGHLANV